MALIKFVLQILIKKVVRVVDIGIKNTEKKWTMPVWNWSLTLSQLAIFFEGLIVNLKFKFGYDKISPIIIYVDTKYLTVSLYTCYTRI